MTAAGADLAAGQAVEWTGDDGRTGHGQLVQTTPGGWALVAAEDGQLQAVPSEQLRRWAPGGQLRIV